MTLCSYDVDCSDIVDLTADGELAAAGVTPADLACPWEHVATLSRTPPSWVMADRLIAGGRAGIVVPSFAAGAGPQDRNVVFWRWSDTLPHRVRVVDAFGRLPSDDSSWR